jgi:hypothetical protein
MVFTRHHSTRSGLFGSSPLFFLRDMVLAITTRRGIMRRGLYVLLGVLLVPTVGLVGDIVTDGKLKSTMSTGAPLDVASDDMVVNLNADMVDGVEGTDLYTKTEVDTLIASAVAGVLPRRYYVTADKFAASASLSACAAGFHMANMFEVLDPSELRYAFDHPDADTRPDAGEGPPTNTIGWIRTGAGDDTREYAGWANCGVWTSSEATDYGTVAALPSYWPDPLASGWDYAPGRVWIVEPKICNYVAAGVWCVED